jgi:hypothetical protein
MIAGVPTKIRTEHLMNIGLQRYLETNLYEEESKFLFILKHDRIQMWQLIDWFFDYLNMFISI